MTRGICPNKEGTPLKFYVYKGMHAKISPTGRTQCSVPHCDQGDREFKGIYKRKRNILGNLILWAMSLTLMFPVLTIQLGEV